MADPFTWVGIIGAAGAALSAVSTISQGAAAQKSAEYQAQVEQNNAKIAQQNATYAQEAGAAQTDIAGIKASQELGAVKANIAAGNIDVNSGSALDVQQTQRESGLLSQETVENNAALQAYGYQTQETGFTAQAGLEQNIAAEAVPGSLLSGAGSLLSNVGTLPSKYAWMTNSGGSLATPIGLMGPGP